MTDQEALETEGKMRKFSQTTRYEAHTFINDETCGFEIFDHALECVVERGTGYDGNYAAGRGAQEAIDWLTGEHWGLHRTGGHNCQFSTDSHAA